MKLSDSQIKEQLKNLSGWMLFGSKIIKQFEFKDFKEAINFVNKIAEVSEEEQHQPDISIVYNKVKLELSTHNEGGLTEKDFRVAGKIDALN